MTPICEIKPISVPEFESHIALEHICARTKQNVNGGAMKFRRNCFTTLFLLTLIIGVLWLVSGLSASNTQTDTEAEEAGQTIGQGIGATIILCITLPLVALFALMAWRNSVGMATERRHQEQLDALRNRSE